MSTHDPTASKSAQGQDELSAVEKLDAVRKLMKEIGTAMFTSQSPNGTLASRPMIPATDEKMVLSFFFNQQSGKTDDLKNDDQVNLAFLNPKTADWVSVAGKASINADRSKVKKHWTSGLKAWFDDKGDGKHTGDENDPRVAMIDVHPEEIRFFKADGKIKFLLETASAAVSGKPASGGQLIIISQEEIQAYATANM